MKTKKEIIDETVAYYCEDVTRRAIDLDSGRCDYLTEDNKMCAVGRCFEKEGLARYSGQLEPFSLNMFKFLKEEYRIELYDFWKHLQEFHDTPVYWDKEGLTEKGKAYVNFLHSEYDMPIEIRGKYYG